MVVGNTTAAASNAWVMDMSNKIHVASDLTLCLAATNPVTVARCDNGDASQHWNYTLQDNDPARPILQASNGQCADRNGSTNRLELYGCHGNWNQRWFDLPVNHEVWLAYFNADAIAQLRSYLGN